MSQERFLETSKTTEYHVEVKFMEMGNRKIELVASNSYNAILGTLDKLSYYEKDEVISVRITYVSQ